jgi:hypothetical protein
VRTCVSNRDTDPPIQKLLHAVGMLCIGYYAAWNGCHSRVEVPRQQPQKKNVGFPSVHVHVHALLTCLKLETWLQAGGGRAIAYYGGQPSG